MVNGRTLKNGVSGGEDAAEANAPKIDVTTAGARQRQVRSCPSGNAQDEAVHGAMYPFLGDPLHLRNNRE